MKVAELAIRSKGTCGIATMSGKTPCPHCGTIGFVRKEHIFRAGDSYTQFYCGYCNRAWAEASGERRKAPRATTDKPDRSRS